MKCSRQFQSVGHASFARNKAQAGRHLYGSGHHGRGGAHTELEQIFNPRASDYHVEFYVMTRGRAHANHRPAGCKRGVQERGFHRAQIGVSGGAVDDGVELRMERHRMPAGCNLEIRRVGPPTHHNVAQSSRILTGGGERSRDAFNRA